MSITTGAICIGLKSTGESPIAFKARNFINMSPGKAAEIPIFSFPDEHKAHYDLKLANIAGLAKAQIENVISHQTTSAYTVFNLVVDLPGLMFYKPIGVFKFRDVTEEIINNCQEGGLTRDPAHPDVFRGCPTFASFGSIMKHQPATYRPSDLECTPDAMVAYIFLTKGLAIFGTLSNSFSHAKGTIAFAGSGIIEKGELEVEGPATGEKGMLKLDAVGWGVMNVSTIHSASIPTDSSQGFKRGYKSLAHIQKISSEHGRFFPYFEGQMIPDRNFAYNVFARVFPQLLSTDMTRVPALLQRIRAGASALAPKTAGMALSHAYLGISLAVSAHAAVTFVVTRGSYQGFVLSGNFKVVFYKDVIDAIPKVDVIDSLTMLTSHERSMQKIKGFLEMKKLPNGLPMFPFEIDLNSSSRLLLRFLKTIDYEVYKDIPGWQNDLDKEIDQLDFEDEEFAKINTQTVIDFLLYLQTGDEQLLSTKPAFLRGGYYRSCINNKIATGLGVFGQKAPSCNFGPKTKSIVFNIPKEGTADSNLEIREGVRPLKYLPFQAMHPQSAIAQWTSLFSEGTLRLPEGNKKRSEFCNMSGVVLHIHHDTPLGNVYNAIKAYSSVTRSSTGKKRKAATVEDKGGKRARATTSTKDIMDLY